MICVSNRVENIVGKGENAGLPAFFPLPAFSSFLTMFSIGFFVKVVKSQDCEVKS